MGHPLFSIIPMTEILKLERQVILEPEEDIQAPNASSQAIS